MIHLNPLEDFVKEARRNYVAGVRWDRPAKREDVIKFTFFINKLYAVCFLLFVILATSVYYFNNIPR